MNTERNCQFCNYYKDGYCENLELKPCYPQKGCDDFSYSSVKSKLKQESKVKAFDILHFVADNARLSTFEAIEKAYMQGYKDGESDALDRMRAEIEQLPITDTAIRLVTEILDKYKAESEE